MLQPSELTKISFLIGAVVGSLLTLAGTIVINPHSSGPVVLTAEDLASIQADLETQVAPLKARLEALATPVAPAVDPSTPL